jgi:hypothetical protein
MRLGPRAGGFWQQFPDAGPDDLSANDGDMTDDAGRMGGMPSDVKDVAIATPEAVATPDDRNAELDRAIAQAAGRLDEWLASQQRQLTAGLDVMIGQLKERRQAEIARLETWKKTERDRVERELATDEEHFRERLMAELVAFEEQLGLRLQEQEERLAKWWTEAEQMVDRRFADLSAPKQ